MNDHDPTPTAARSKVASPPPSSQTRRRRTQNPVKRAGVLTARDLELLTFIGRCRIAPTNAIANAFFSDRSTACRRLARLLGAGLLRVAVPNLSAPNVFSLSERAAELLVAEGEDPEALHVGRFPKREALDHLCYLAELRAAFLVGLRVRADIALTTFLSDHDLRRIAGARTPSYVPDALVQLAGSAGPIGLLYEFDAGHQTAKLIAETKGRATRLAAEALVPLWGLTPWRAVFIAPSAARLRSVARALTDEGAGALWLGTTVDRLAECGVLGAAYGTVSDIVAAERAEPLPLTERVVPPPAVERT